LKIKEKAGSLLVLDHHLTARDELAGLDFCTFDMDRSGAMLAWNHFNPDRTPPDLIKYVQDRDLWKWELPNSEAYSIGLASYDQSFETWSMLAHQTPKIIKEGEMLLKFQRKQIGLLSLHVHMAVIGGHKVPAVNSPLFVSETAHGLCKQFPDLPFAAAYHTDENTDRKWSLRSINDFDVSAVAKQYGGGGHARAAGFIEKADAISITFSPVKP
jgi:oligoribonuclease NrnB/cAMP/cGMP phosphodiesterase (DHH superfamily)